MTRFEIFLLFSQNNSWDFDAMTNMIYDFVVVAFDELSNCLYNLT